MVASAVNARTEAVELRRLTQPWQWLALARYDDVGECWYPAQFYSRTMQRVRFFAGYRDDKGDVQEQEAGPVADLWNRVQDPGGGITELTGSYGHLMFLTGDGYLVAGDDDGQEVWEYLSPVELRVLPESGPGGQVTYRRLRAPGLTPEELIEAPDGAFSPMGDEVRVYRLYRRHPTYSFWADSPTRSVLDLYQLLKMLTLAAGAEAQSRAANRGLLYVPEDLSFTSPSAEAGEEDPMQDTFLQDFIEGLMRAISDPGDAGAMAPFVMRGPGLANTGVGTSTPMADLIKWIQMGPPDSYRAVDAWDKVIQRIGNGLDLPGTIVTGEARNHWGDWLVDEQGFRQHVAPICEKFASDMVAAYLRPAARDAGIANWQDVAIGYDPSDAVNHPATVKEAHDRLIVSDAYYRTVIGATEQDAPDDDELERRTLVKINVDPYAPTGPLEPDGAQAPQDGGSGNDVTEAPPEATPAEQASPVASLAAARVLGASEAHIMRARSLAGARLRNRSQGCAECQETAKGLTASAVAPAFGVERVRDIINGHGSEADLVAGAGDELAETLGRMGVLGEWPTELGRLVELHALRTLYESDPPPLPSGFTAAVAKAVAA